MLVMAVVEVMVMKLVMEVVVMGVVVEVFEVCFFFFGWLFCLILVSPRAKDGNETRPLVGFLHANNRGALE